MGALQEKENTSIDLNTQDELVIELTSFFDLLAKFDYEDNQKEKTDINSSSP
jgi:hypothetical protein